MFYLGKNLKARGGNLISPQGKAGLMNRIELIIKYSDTGFYLYKTRFFWSRPSRCISLRNTVLGN
jgi:hypothetical protein